MSAFFPPWHKNTRWHCLDKNASVGTRHAWTHNCRQLSSNTAALQLWALAGATYECQDSLTCVHNQLAGTVELIRALAAPLIAVTNSLALECFRYLCTSPLSGQHVSMNLLINIQAISLLWAWVLNWNGVKGILSAYFKVIQMPQKYLILLFLCNKYQF